MNVIEWPNIHVNGWPNLHVITWPIYNVILHKGNINEKYKEYRCKKLHSITVEADNDILQRGAIKAARGVVYNDTGAYTVEKTYEAVYIPVTEVERVRDKDKNEVFWKAMGSDLCLHDFYGPNFAARRLYVIDGEKENPAIICFLGLILASAFYIVLANVPYADIKNRNLPVCQYNI